MGGRGSRCYERESGRKMEKVGGEGEKKKNNIEKKNSTTTTTIQSSHETNKHTNKP
jgi:hypothetical protein